MRHRHVRPAQVTRHPVGVRQGSWVKLLMSSFFTIEYTSRERDESKPWIKTRLPYFLKHITEERDLENFQDLVVA